MQVLCHGLPDLVHRKDEELLERSYVIWLTFATVGAAAQAMNRLQGEHHGS